jgi:hypothetical protein
MKIRCPRCAYSSVESKQPGKFRCRLCGSLFPAENGLIALGDAKAAVKAVDHPIRQAITAQLAVNGELSPSQISEKTGIDLGTVSYHMAVLRETVPPLVKCSRTVPVRGAVQNFYELVNAE